MEMSPGAALLERAQEWIRQEVGDGTDLTAVSEVEFSLAGRAPRSVSWVLDGESFMAQLVLWDTGEFEEDLATVETGQVQTRSGRLTSPDELERRLAAARDWALQGR
ncbi:hypothetical protein ACFWZ2_20240 [Streptomyces sp. NPDC059002]|uniref:hypothetical protein n=1 Tax=Streptomyces sp. NPDC059002 TaxID=3346690 RepID=UPI00367E8634